MEYILAGDVSGTHTRIFVFDTENFSISHLKEFETHNIEDFSTLLKKYLTDLDFSIKNGVMACAGKVNKGRVSLANSSLVIDTLEIKKILDIEIILINDFEAIAFGVSSVDEKKLCEVIPTLHKSQRQLFIGAGTGLGCGVFSGERNYENKESGHLLAQEVLIEYPEVQDLLGFAQDYYGKKNVEIEDILSGTGLEMLNKYITGEEKKAKDVNDIKVLNEFFKIYAHTINYFAKKYDCSFVYVAGGIVGKRYHEINEWNFTQYLNHHLGITLVLDYDVSLYGLIEYYRIKNYNVNFS